jgi:hypothetical protein
MRAGDLIEPVFCFRADRLQSCVNIGAYLSRRTHAMHITDLPADDHHASGMRAAAR